MKLPFIKNYKNDRPFLDKDGRLFGKYDVFKPLLLLIVITLVFFIAKVLLQKDEYVTVELYASGGEWWFNNPDPPYWLTDTVKKGGIEYDPQGGKLVEILDTQKFEVGQRKMLWIKARLRVVGNSKDKQYRFRREPLQIGSVVYVAPDNVKVYCNVVSIEGVGVKKVETEKVVTVKEYDLQPWLVDAVNVGDTMKDGQGSVIAEVLEKKVVNAQTTTTDDRGNLYVKANPLKRDITMRVRVKAVVSEGSNYFAYYQPLKVGYYLWFPFERVNIGGNITLVE